MFNAQVAKKKLEPKLKKKEINPINNVICHVELAVNRLRRVGRIIVMSKKWALLVCRVF